MCLHHISNMLPMEITLTRDSFTNFGWLQNLTFEVLT